MVLVFGVVGVFIGNVVLSDQGQLGFGFEQMIHARIPWLLLGSLGIGSALGIWSLVRARRWYKWVIVPVELIFAGLLTFYFTSASFLPRHDSTDRRPALYIFYRGDW